MPSLSVHLRRDEDHAGLPFHPGCPVCRRERLAGSLAGDELVSRRTQAKIAAGLLAFSGLGAPSAVAADPDTVTEGTAEAVDEPDPVALDIGPDTVELADETEPAPDVAAAPIDAVDDEAALEQGGETEAVEPAIETEATDEAPVPIAEAPPTGASEVVTPEPADAPPASNIAETASIRSERAKRRTITPKRSAKTTTDRTATVIVPTETAPTSPAAAPPPRTIQVVAGATSGGPAKAGNRVHIVRRGESLWSIASDLLGTDASTARVAREVTRLWQLNEDRIATGSPDLLFAGTRLRLR